MPYLPIKLNARSIYKCQFVVDSVHANDKVTNWSTLVMYIFSYNFEIQLKGQRER